MIPNDEYHWALRNDFATFVQRAFQELNPQTEFLDSPFIDILVAKLDLCRRGHYKRFTVNLPPRSLKSHIASIALPAFILGHNPSAKIICASYGQALAEKLARDTKTLMQSTFYREIFPATKLSPDKHSASDFSTTAGGYRMATSVGGPLTGRGADYIILDDTLKPDDALSDTRRTGVNEWFDNSLRSRLDSKKDGVIINVMQRLHMDDLVGYLLAKEDWEVLSFAAIAEEDEYYSAQTPLGEVTFSRKKGEALHPEREPLSVLHDLRQHLGEYNFLSQYQQEPVPAGGAMVKREWLAYYDVTAPLPKFTMKVSSWDTANKVGELNDYSVCTTLGSYEGKFYVLDVFRARLNYPDLKRKVKELGEKHRPDAIIIEDKASGTQLIQDLKADGVYKVRDYKPLSVMDKPMRLHAQTAEFENGKVVLPSSAPWKDEFVRELTSFPIAKYDDQVDSITQALDYMKRNRTLETWRILGSQPYPFTRR